MMMGFRKSRWYRWGGTAVGIALMGAAVWFAQRGADWEVLGRASAVELAALGAAVGVHLFLTGLMFWVVTLSFPASPRVGLWRMTQVIAASSLLNFLPMYAGLLGRAAYLKAKHDIALADSVRVLVIVVVMGVCVSALAAGVVECVPRQAWWIAAVAGLAAISGLTSFVAPWLLRRRLVLPWTWIFVRALETLLAGARLWVALRVVGGGLSLGEAVMIAGAGLVVSALLPLPNGIGIREWTIVGLSGLGPLGAMAALLDRAVEAMVFTAAGVWSVARLSAEPIAIQPPTPRDA